MGVIDIFMLVGMLALLGACSGFMAGLLGIGGGIILVPGLYIIFSTYQSDMAYETANIMHMSVGTSLAIIVPTGISSALAHRGSVDFNLVSNIGAGIIGGVVVATWIAYGIEAGSLKIIFASAIFILSLIMIINPARFQISDRVVKQPFSSMAGFIIGCLSALIGIGGASLSVPYMSLGGISMHRAIGSASALGVIIALPAMLGFMVIGLGVDNLPPFSIGYVSIFATIFIVFASVIFAPIGASVAHKISVRKLQVIFAVFMMIVAINAWVNIIMGGG